MKFEIVTTTDRLDIICIHARQQKHVMLDTEFVRTRTLFPKLGLIQLFDGKHLALIDPLAIPDLSPLWALLEDEGVIKVLHACGEDLEVFQHHAGCIPKPMLDTQIMAAFLGHGISTGFGALVSEYVGVDLEKGEARTNWLARPLTDNQLDYAAADVEYLLPLFETLLDKVIEKEWLDAVELECNSLVEKRLKHRDINLAYLDIKNVWQLTPKQLAVLQIAAKWRVEEARKRDIALNFIVKEFNLWKLAFHHIKSKAKMSSEGFEPMEIHHHGARMIKMVLDAERLSEDQYPQPLSRLVDYPGYKQLVKVIKDQVTEVEKETGLAPEFLASKKQINQLISWAWKHDFAEEKQPDMLKTWRQPLFEARVLPLIKK